MLASHKHNLVKDLSRIIAKINVMSGDLKSWQLEIYELNPTPFGQQVAETIRFHANELLTEADRLRGVIDAIVSSKSAGKPMFVDNLPSALAVAQSQQSPESEEPHL